MFVLFEALRKISHSESENLFQSGADENAMDQKTQETPGHHIMNFIFHDDSSVDRFESMLVEPKRKRAPALFIDKSLQWFNMLDFSEPRHRDTGDCFDAIFDHEAGM